MAAIIQQAANAIAASLSLSLPCSSLSSVPQNASSFFPSKIPAQVAPTTVTPPLITSLSIFKSKLLHNAVSNSPQSLLCSLPSQPTRDSPPTLHAVAQYFPLISEGAFFDSLFDLLRLSARYGDAELARAVHALVLKLEEDTSLVNALITAYIRGGLVPDAYRVLLGLSRPNVVSYTALVSAFSKSNREDEAVDLFFRMWGSGIEPNEYSFVAVLTACIRIMNFCLGEQIHATAIKMGYLGSVFVSNALMGLYSKCGCLDSVLRLFEESPQRDIATWNTVISSLVKEFVYEEAFDLFRQMRQMGEFTVDHYTLSTLLSACTGSMASMEGQEIHAHAIKVGLDTHLSVSNALIEFYAKCGSVNDVMAVFDKMPVRDVVTWTELMTSYTEFGLLDLAVETFYRMPERNSISCNALLAGFSKNGRGSRAVEFFIDMLEEGIELSAFTLTSVVNACGLLKDCKVSEQVHGFVIKSGLELNDCVETALVDMCMRSGRMADAEKLFHQRPLEKVSTEMLTSVICGYSRNGLPEEAISLFCMSQSEGSITLDEVASASVLGLCGVLGIHEMGKQMHCYSLKSGFHSDVGVGNATISMYCKCWNIEDAIRVFNTITKHDVVSWNCLIAGHLLHWQGDKALALWEEMKTKGIKPDKFTFELVISAYRHTNLGLLDQCRSLFSTMETIYDIKPSSEHYVSLVRVLGRWGLLEEAEETIRKMPFEPEVSVWRALLDSCRIHSNSVIGRRVAQQILASEPKDPSTYILVSNLLSASGRWQCSEVLRQDMRKKGLHKHPAQSWIIHQNKIHSFYARDKAHPQAKDISRGLDILIMECLKVGYVPDTSFVLHEVEEYQKKDFLFYHSAKLAATYGILTTEPGKPIRILKNVLLCGDCHSFLKYTSLVTGREIIVRDTSGFHSFTDGHCSCKDYW